MCIKKQRIIAKVFHKFDSFPIMNLSLHFKKQYRCVLVVEAVNICVWGGEMRDDGVAAGERLSLCSCRTGSVFWLSLCKHTANTHNSKHEHLNTCLSPACLPPLIKNWLAVTVENKNYPPSLLLVGWQTCKLAPSNKY